MATTNKCEAMSQARLPDELWLNIVSFAVPDLIVRHNGVPLDYPSGLLGTDRKFRTVTKHVLSERQLKVYLSGVRPTILSQEAVEYNSPDEAYELRRKAIKAWSKVPYTLYRSIEVNVHPELLFHDVQITGPCRHPQLPFLRHLEDVRDLAVSFSTLLQSKLYGTGVIHETNISLKFHNVCPFHDDRGQTESLLPAWTQQSVYKVVKSFDWVAQLTSVGQTTGDAIQLPRTAWLFDSRAGSTVKECENMLRARLCKAWLANHVKPEILTLGRLQPLDMRQSMADWVGAREDNTPHKRMLTSPTGLGLHNQDTDAWNTSEILYPYDPRIKSLKQTAINNIDYQASVRKRRPQVLNTYFGREMELATKLFEAVKCDLKYYAQTVTRLEDNLTIIKVACRVFSLLLTATYSARQQCRRMTVVNMRTNQLVAMVNNELDKVIHMGLMGKEEHMQYGIDTVEAETFSVKAWGLITAEERFLSTGRSRVFGKKRTGCNQCG